MDLEEGREEPLKRRFKDCKRLSCLSRERKEMQREADVVDFREADKFERVLSRVKLNLRPNLLQTKYRALREDFVDPATWEGFTFPGLPEGLLVIPRILTGKGSQKWFHKLINEIPRKEANNLKANIALPPTEPSEESNLRWVTFGLHHNWDTKVYDEGSKGRIPPEIYELTTCISDLLGLDWRPEAGIINYYTCKSSLGPHTDRSEANARAPLLSLSLGSGAVFVCGGSSRESEPVVAMELKDADLVVMSGEARLSFHAVPKVFCPVLEAEAAAGAERGGGECFRGKKVTRVNLNVRQVY